MHKWITFWTELLLKRPAVKLSAVIPVRSLTLLRLCCKDSINKGYDTLSRKDQSHVALRVIAVVPRFPVAWQSFRPIKYVVSIKNSCCFIQYQLQEEARFARHDGIQRNWSERPLSQTWDCDISHFSATSHKNSCAGKHATFLEFLESRSWEERNERKSQKTSHSMRSASATFSLFLAWNLSFPGRSELTRRESRSETIQQLDNNFAKEELLHLCVGWHKNVEMNLICDRNLKFQFCEVLPMSALQFDIFDQRSNLTPNVLPPNLLRGTRSMIGADK